MLFSLSEFILRMVKLVKYIELKHRRLIATLTAVTKCTPNIVAETLSQAKREKNAKGKQRIQNLTNACRFAYFYSDFKPFTFR